MNSAFQTMPTQRRLHLHRCARLRRLVRSDRGSVAIEFVIIVPLMLLVLLGFTEMYLYMRAVSIVERTAFTLANSVGQMPQVINDPSTSNANNLGSVWNTATLLAAPDDLKANGGIILTSICDTTTSCVQTQAAQIPPTKGTPKIAWTQNASWMTKSSSPSRITSANLLPKGWPFYAGDSATAIEVFYTYTPFAMTTPFWTSAPGTQTIYKVVYVRQRSGLPLTLAPAG
jgi:Flp pilus assembly protein TadG